MIAGLLTIGLILVASALKGTEHELGARVQADLLGSQGFITWALAIVGIGCIGWIPGLEKTSRYLLALLLVALVVKNGGLFANVQQALQQASQAGPAVPVALPAYASSTASSGSTAGSSPGSAAVSALGDAAKVATLALAL